MQIQEPAVRGRGLVDIYMAKPSDQPTKEITLDIEADGCDPVSLTMKSKGTITIKNKSAVGVFAFTVLVAPGQMKIVTKKEVL